MAQSAKQNCEICMSARGSEYCLDCCQHFCKNCKLTHLRIAVCKNHRFQNSETAVSDASIFCQDHNEAYVFICDQCELPVCRICTTKSHKGHCMADIAENVSEKKMTILASVQSILNSNEMNDLEDFDLKIEETTKKLDSNTRNTVSSIQKQGEMITESVNRIVGQMVEEVKQHSTSGKEKLNQFLSEINDKKSFKDTLLQKQQTIRTSKDDIGLLDKIKELEKSINSNEIPCMPHISTFRYKQGQIHEDVLKNLLGNVDFMGSDVVGKECLLSGEVFDGILSHGTAFRNRICLLREEVKTMKNKDDSNVMMLFYRNQMLNELNDIFVQKIVKCFIETNEKSKSIVMRSIEVLNEVAPGLLLQVIANQKDADIIVTDKNQKFQVNAISIQWKRASSVAYSAFIELGQSYEVSEAQFQGEITFEILHAIGFHHSMTKLFYALACDSEAKENERETIKRFDPYSILLLGTNNMQSNGVCVLENNGNNVYSLSELDKVGLNLLFPSCITKNYKPCVSAKTHLLYCGRRVMADHNRPEKSSTDGRCGPNDGANCPACRTIVEKEKKEMTKLIANGRFQGWSGHIYCGNTCYSNRGQATCGPNYGDSCFSCSRLLVRSGSQ